MNLNLTSDVGSTITLLHSSHRLDFLLILNDGEHIDHDFYASKYSI